MSMKSKIDSLIDNYHQAMNKLNVPINLTYLSRARKIYGILNMKKSRELLRWCREGESNPHEVALAGF